MVRPGERHRAAINAEMLNELKAVKSELADHIRKDDERNADEHRARILRFNNELLRDIPHTKEEFVDVLADIDFYERYCRAPRGLPEQSSCPRHRQYQPGL